MNDLEYYKKHRQRMEEKKEKACNWISSSLNEHFINALEEVLIKSDMLKIIEIGLKNFIEVTINEISKKNNGGNFTLDWHHSDGCDTKKSGTLSIEFFATAKERERFPLVDSYRRIFLISFLEGRVYFQKYRRLYPKYIQEIISFLKEFFKKMGFTTTAEKTL